MVVPTLATIVVGTNGLLGHIDTASSADRARVMANLSQTAGELVHLLQDERVAAVMALGAEGDEVSQRATRYADVQQRVDELQREFQRESDAVAEAPQSYEDLLETIDGHLSRLPDTRNQVTGGGIGIIATTAFYQDTIANLISLRDLSAQVAAETTDTALSDRMRAAVAVSQAKEFLSQRRVVGHVVLIRGAYNPYLRTAYIGAQAGFDQALQIFNVVATADDLALMDGALHGPEARQSDIYQGNLNSLDAGSLRTLPWDAETWDEALSAHANQLWAVETELDSLAVNQAVDLRDAVTRQVLVQSGALLAVLLVAILLAWLVARSMVRSLRALRQGALSVAQYGLPQAVARLRDPSLSTQLSPDQVASQIAEPLPVRSRDEFGQVAEAFNVVHMEAVRTAAEQAQLRSSVAAMFVNLARRSQILVDRLIGQLDRLERSEEDPDRLAELFQLDHLATRMRRTDENLLVLAGADSTRVQRDPAPMIDVLRAAQSEVEQYTRIEFGVVDRDLQVAAHAVNDLVHLVAELLDNATVFSPPDTHVLVEARRVGDRAALYVQDRGLGLSAEQLAEINERLAKPPLVDVAVSRMMGLVVVARLAARHGVKVELRPAPGRGTIADVTLPSSVLLPATGQAAPPAPPLERRRPEPAGEQRALESGPSTLPGGADASAPASDRTAAGSGIPAEGFAATAASFASAPSFTPPAPPAEGPPRRDDAGQPPVRSGRPLPAWSDLVGTTGHNGSEPGQNSSAAPTLPRRQPSTPGFVDGVGSELTFSDGGTEPPPPPRRGDTVSFIAGPPSSASQKPPPLPVRRPARPASSTPPAEPPRFPEQRTASPSEPAPASATPPPWPPPPSPATSAGAGTPEPTPASAAAPAEAMAEATQANEVVAGRQAAAASSGQATEAARPYTPPPPPPPAPVGDQTMELPIFRELESVWFRTRRPAGEAGEQRTATATAEAANEYASVSASAGASGASGSASGGTGGPPPEPLRTGGGGSDGVYRSGAVGSGSGGPRTGGSGPASPGSRIGQGDGWQDEWRTAADEGWRAASSAAEGRVAEVTAAGLPKRRPMAQLVPGGVERAPTGPITQRRSPEAVRGLLSAYHRGVQRGRGQAAEEVTGGSGGSQSTQAGKEQQT